MTLDGNCANSFDQRRKTIRNMSQGRIFLDSRDYFNKEKTDVPFDIYSFVGVRDLH